MTKYDDKGMVIHITKARHHGQAYPANGGTWITIKRTR